MKYLHNCIRPCSVLETKSFKRTIAIACAEALKMLDVARQKGAHSLVAFIKISITIATNRVSGRLNSVSTIERRVEYPSGRVPLT